jgi:tetratricopeptide (TPR) repeat protein
VEGVDRARLLIEEYLVDEAEAILRKALEDCPGYAEAGLLLLPILEDKEAFDEALGLARSLRLPPEEKTMVVARYLTLAGDREAAVARLDEIPFNSPRFVDSRLLAADLLLKADPPRVEAALTRAKSAASKASKDAESWGVVGLIILNHLDDREGALKALLTARDLDPLNPRWDRALERLYGRGR